MVLCDAVIIYYGTASEHWVRMKLFDLVKAPGWGRRGPFRAKAVWVAEPVTPPQGGVRDRRGAGAPRDRGSASRSLWSRFSPSSPRPRPGDDADASVQPLSRTAAVPRVGGAPVLRPQRPRRRAARRAGEIAVRGRHGRVRQREVVARERRVCCRRSTAGSSPRAGSHWRIAAFRPGANPIHNLARALAVPEVLATDDADPVIAAAQVEATLRRSGLGLADAARQGERVWTAAACSSSSTSSRSCSASTPTRPGERSATTPRRSCSCSSRRRGTTRRPSTSSLTMRSDFLGDCSQFRELPEAINDGALPRPPADPDAAPGGDHRAGRGRRRRRSARGSSSGCSTTPAPIPTCCPSCSTP